MDEPVIFLAFANAELNPLPDLQAEDRSVYQALSEMHDAGTFTLHRDSFASTDSILRSLQNFRNRVSIFHFGGHAGNTHLQVTDQALMQAGLVQLLASQKTIRLVFLNGCNTSGFIEALLAKGVPVVIATARAIEDPLAVRLASEFYTALTKGASLEEAFATAKAVLESLYALPEGKVEVRGIQLPQKATADFPWGLYGKKEALQWRLKDAHADVNPLPSRSGLRIGALTFIVFASFLWGVIHLGAGNVMTYLTIGPFALVGIGTAVIRLTGSNHSGISQWISKPTQWIAKTMIKPWVIVMLGIIVIGLFGFFSSLCVEHPGREPINAKLLNAQSKDATYWRLDALNPDRTRLVTLLNPAERTHILQVNGFADKKVTYQLFTGARLPVDSLSKHAVLFVRLGTRNMNLRQNAWVEVLFPNGVKHTSRVFRDANTYIIGNAEAGIDSGIVTAWDREVPGLGNLWAKAFADTSGVLLTPGDSLSVKLLSQAGTHSEKRVKVLSSYTDIVLD